MEENLGRKRNLHLGSIVENTVSADLALLSSNVSAQSTTRDFHGVKSLAGQADWKYGQ